MYSVVNEMWAEVALGCPDHILLAERDLARQLIKQKDFRSQWLLYCKLGAIAVLLLWSTSEIFNNESSQQRHIWNVRNLVI